MFKTGKRIAMAVPAVAIGALLVGSAVPANAATAPQRASATAASATTLDLTQFVDPRIGTSTSATSGYAGNINPGAKAPFGMVTFGPDMSRSNYNGSGGYLVSPTATSARVNFFSLTHMGGTGCPGGSVVGMLPRTTPVSVTNASGNPQSQPTFQTSTESAKPGAYSVKLDSGVQVDLGATTRTGSARFTYPDANAAFFTLDTRLNANSNMSSTSGQVSASNVSLTVADNGKTLSGKTVAPAFCTPWGTPYTSNVFFYAELDKQLKTQSDPASTVNKVANGSAVLQYDLSTSDPTLNLRVGISSVSIENAKLNLRTENATQTLEAVRTATDKAWNTRLNSIQIDQAANPATLTPEQRANLVKFYTALYRVYGSPTVYSDVNGDFRSMRGNKPYPTSVDTAGNVEQRPTANVSDYDYKKVDGSTGTYSTHYSGLSLWDTYRSQAQLLAMLAPDVASDVAQSIVVDGVQCGALPHWVDASDDSVPMSGDNALPVLAGTYAFGGRDFDLITAAKLVKQSGLDPTSACNGNKSFGAFAEFTASGYIPGRASDNIERYASDFAGAEFLRSVGPEVRQAPSVAVTDADIATIADRANLWPNILDKDSGKIIDRAAPTTPGTLGPISPGTFHESTEPNYFWSFPDAWDGLIDGIGGKAAAIKRLNTLFSMDDALTATPTLSQLNGGESSQTFYMGNEMGYPAPWAYNWAGKPAASQYVVSQLRKTGFGTGRDGMPGNDDMGAQSSWFVYASLGVFPVVPSKAGLAVSTPLFPAATVWMNGKPVRITTDGDPSTAPFIDSMQVDGHEYGRSWMQASTFAGAGEITFTLSKTPTTWAADVHPTAAAETTTTLALSPTSVKAGSATTAKVTVTSADKTLPKGTVEIRLATAGTTTARAAAADALASGPLGADGTANLQVTIPAGTPASKLRLVATFVPADPTFLQTSTSDAVDLTVTAAPVVTPTPEPSQTPEPSKTPGTTPTPIGTPQPTASDGLAVTGAETAEWLPFGALLAGAAGLVLVLVARRRARRA